ncbi:hypothetical protein LNV09_20640 [Paucibacter sp. B2R-40]|uniref:hypothetical protein n=1 Tax=Paucibacter sp. B2R-40 TaxID=2893554 RepID=UPI0021E3A7EF|nr:hypothetical protein [Paucibacter sp. B2R-40]MCV2356556.1 hypothetical protein [Paucibacter sp. B2R-40]
MFTSVFFYQEESGQLYPLSDLREGVRVRAERSVITAAWAKIEAELGWCRLPEPKVENGKRARRGGA